MDEIGYSATPRITARRMNTATIGSTAAPVMMVEMTPTGSWEGMDLTHCSAAMGTIGYLETVPTIPRFPGIPLSTVKITSTVVQGTMSCKEAATTTSWWGARATIVSLVTARIPTV